MGKHNKARKKMKDVPRRSHLAPENINRVADCLKCIETNPQWQNKIHDGKGVVDSQILQQRIGIDKKEMEILEYNQWS